jgi:threonyl-tRNA synthetase
VRLIPVAEPHREAVHAVRERIQGAGYRVDMDERDDTLGKRIRDAEVEKIPYVIVYGDKESDDALAVRQHGGGQSTKSLAGLLTEFAALVAKV